MENYIEKLNELIALKKNKGHKITKKEREEFISAWSNLAAADNSFSERAEQYYYDGFVFAGAKPFVNWLLSTEDHITALDSLFKGKLFGKDTSSSFRVLISTFALLIKEKHVEDQLVCTLIRRIPSCSKNKEKKTIGDGHRIFLKYFIGEFDSTTALPSLPNLNLKPFQIQSFVSVCDELISKLDKDSLSKKEMHVLSTINSWLHPVVLEESQEKTTETKQEKKTFSEGCEATFELTQDSIKPRQSISPYERLVSILNEAVSLSGVINNNAHAVESKSIDFQKTISSLQKDVDALNDQLKQAKDRETYLESKLDDRSRLISTLNEKIRVLEEDVGEKTSLVAAKDQEIAQRMQMMEALSRDRARQSEEQFHRLASKLKIEYRDFKDAEALSMDCVLGENMREQLKNVFSILSRAGISLD